MAQEDVAPIRVGLLGAGTVGSQTARLLVEQKDELAARIGRPIELTGVACLDPAETDPFPWIDKAIVTTDTMSVATNSDIVIELIGGTGVARKFVLAAIESGASVVTANKALLAKYGPEIYAAWAVVPRRTPAICRSSLPGLMKAAMVMIPVSVFSSKSSNITTALL